MDSKTFQIAHNYALSLFTVSLEQEQMDLVYRELQTSAPELLKNRTFQAFVKAPHIPSKTKIQALRNAFKQNTHSFSLSVATQNFLLLLVKNNRFYLLPAILTCLKKIRDLNESVCKITATSADLMSNVMQKLLTTKLEKALQKPIKITFKRDKSLLGGISVKFDKYVIDASVKNKIDKIQSL